MPKVKLKHNMIFGGTFYTFGTVMEEKEIPLNLRKSKYLTEPDKKEAVRLSEDEEVEQEIFFDEVDEVEELPPTRIPTDSRAKYFKPKPKK